MGDLCSVQDVKDYLGGFTSADDDALLARLVSASSSWLQNQIGLIVAQQSFTETLNGDGTTSMLLRNPPVLSIDSLTIDGLSIPARSATDGGYVLQDDRVWLSGPSGAGGVNITPGPLGPYMSPTRLTALRFTVGNANVIVTYTAGYSAVPADLAQAAIELAGGAYQRRNRLGIMARSIGGESTNFQTLSLDAGLKGVLDAYRRTRI